MALNRIKKITFCAGILIILSGVCNSSGAEDTYPQRIISLGPGITEELYLLGAEEKVIGVTTYCQRPAQARRKTKVGTVMEVNLEKIVSLRPDLVLLTGLTDNKIVEQLKKFNIQTAVFKEAKTFNETCGQFLTLAKLIGKKTEAINIIQEAIDKRNFIKDKTSNLKKPKVFMQIGSKPLFTLTEDSFLNDLIKFAGGINIASDTKSGLYSREKVIAANPDVIIIVTMGIQGQEEIKAWSKYRTLNAVKNNRIYLVDAEKICSPTPVTFIQTLEEIVKILHEEKNI